MIAQITDLHLRDDGAYPCHDAATALLQAFDRIAALDRRPDAIVLTGDIIDRSAAGYDRAVALMRKSPVPVLPLSGNHDRAPAFREAFAGWAGFHPDHLSFAQPMGDATLVALDSNLRQGRGGVDAARLDWLADTLARAAGPVILALHHPPFPTGAPHIDRQGFARAADLAAMVADSRVCRIIAGHSHRGMQTVWAGVQASTCRAAGFGLSLAFTDGSTHTPECIASGFELHVLGQHLMISHQFVLPHEAVLVRGLAGPV